MLRVFFLIALLPGFASAQMTSAEKKATVEFMAGLYDKETGGYKVDAKSKPGLRPTSGALRAYKFLGIDVPHDRDTISFMTSRCNGEVPGSFCEPGSKAEFTSTCIALMGYPELGLKPKDDWAASLKYLKDNAKTFEDVRLGAAALECIGKKPEWIADWIKLADAQLNNDGTAGKGDGQARDTASVAAMKLRLGYPVANKAKVTDAIVNGQRADGGWGKTDAKASDLETSYRVMRALYLMKAKPKDAKAVSDFLGKCRNKDGGYSVEPGGASTMSGVYYATAINKWLEK